MDKEKDKVMKITTSIGFEYEIDRDILDDMELFEDLMTIEDPDAGKVERTRATNRIFQRLLGDEQKKRLDDFLKARDGRVRFSAYQREIFDVFASMSGDKKKS